VVDVIDSYPPSHLNENFPKSSLYDKSLEDVNSRKGSIDIPRQIFGSDKKSSPSATDRRHDFKTRKELFKSIQVQSSPKQDLAEHSDRNLKSSM
jgi:hypothetical protein